MKVIALFLFFSTTLSAQTIMNTRMRSNAFNPGIGINTMMLAQNSLVDSEDNGMSLQGVELQFDSAVDAYLRARIVIGIHREGHDHEEEAAKEDHGHINYAIHPEEAFVETTSIPYVTLKAGKFLSQFGKYNSLHLHALPSNYRSYVHTNYFGSDGFTAPGVSLSFLVPLNWYSEITVESLQSTNEELFGEINNGTAYMAKFKNLWDLSDETTVEWGVSGLNFLRHPYNDHVEESTKLVGTDFTIKWRPVTKGRTKSFLWSTEYIRKELTGTENYTNSGVTSYLRYQFLTRWFAQYQYEYLGLEKTNEDFALVNSIQLGFVPSEFSALRFQYDQIKSNHEEDERRVSLQLNFSIGVHPAHMY